MSHLTYQFILIFNHGSLIFCRYAILGGIRVIVYFYCLSLSTTKCPNQPYTASSSIGSIWSACCYNKINKSVEMGFRYTAIYQQMV